MIRLIMALFLFLIPASAFAFNPAVLFDMYNLEDHGFVEAANSGLTAFEKEKNIKIPVFKPTEEEVHKDDIYPGMVMAAAEKGYSPIVGIGFNFKEAFSQVAPKFPDARFILVDSTLKGDNIESIVFREEEGSYLMGRLAAMGSKTEKIGFVGGRDVEIIRKFACAYAQGARAENQSISILAVMAGDDNTAWANPEKGAELTENLIRQGVDVVFQAAGATGQGVIQAAQKGGILAIGVDINQNGLAPGTVLTSLLKRTDRAVFTALSQAEAGKWKAGVVSLGLKEGGLDWAVDENNKGVFTREMQDRLTELAADIRDGSLKVFVYKDGVDCPYLRF